MFDLCNAPPTPTLQREAHDTDSMSLPPYHHHRTPNIQHHTKLPHHPSSHITPHHTTCQAPFSRTPHSPPPKRRAHNPMTHKAGRAQDQGAPAQRAPMEKCHNLVFLARCALRGVELPLWEGRYVRLCGLGWAMWILEGSWKGRGGILDDERVRSAEC